MSLYLIRHGETDYNHRRCFYGSLDASINAKGHKQAQAIATVMAHYPVSTIYTSTLKRTKETAQLVFPNQDYRFCSLSGFNEKGFGAWEGLTADEIETAFPNEWDAWLKDPFGVTPPEAEPFGRFQERVKKTLAQLLQSKNRDSPVAIVAHLGVLRLIYQELVNPDAVFWDIDFPQGTVTHLMFLEESGWTAHLLPNEGGHHESIDN